MREVVFNAIMQNSFFDLSKKDIWTRPTKAWRWRTGAWTMWIFLCAALTLGLWRGAPHDKENWKQGVHARNQKVADP
jgi:hypothetical protein